jgi:ketosteroid isomerase-like protein
VARSNVQFKCQFSFAAVMLFVMQIAAAPAAAEDFAAEMEAENVRWLAVYNDRNAQASAPLYTLDAIIVPQGGPPIKGHTAIVQFWFEMFKNEFQDPKLEIIDLHIEGKIAFQT